MSKEQDATTMTVEGTSTASSARAASGAASERARRLVEIPIVFTDRVEGQSKMNKRIVREAIWMVWWLRLQSLIRRL
jgi:hypothetical protein